MNEARRVVVNCDEALKSKKAAKISKDALAEKKADAEFKHAKMEFDAMISAHLNMLTGRR